jgi:hypothetical protein
MRTARRQNERGFALLLVFAMAAAAVAMLYLEMPRVAFEHQRNKEGLLAERGEQYIRAIQLFYKKTNRYPQKIEELESTNNVRFLRRRYKDPMTGDEEWRLIHVDSAGQYVDSLIHKRTEEKKESGPSALSSNIIGIGASAEYVPQAGEKTGAAAIRRASDRIIPGMPGGGQLAGQGVPEAGGEAEQSRSGPATAQPQTPVQPGMSPAVQSPFTNQSGQPTPVQGQRPGFPTQGVNSQQGGQLGQPITATPPATGAQQGGGFGFSSGFGGSGGSTTPAPGPNPSQGQFGGQAGGQSSGAASGSFGQNTFGGNPFGGGSRATQGTSNQAVQAIQNMLTNPRQGMGGATGGASASGGPTQGGIVGVASKRDMEGIRLYNERSNYKEWEFLYDRKKALEAEGMAGGGPQAQQGQQGTGPNGMQGQQGTGSSSGFGSFGGSSSGGQQPRPAPGGFGSGSGFGRGN